MSEPQPIEPTVTEPDKEARIEQLLLSGLDHYFAGQYDQAINIWTRVVFLERGHDRARAYIERARGALAERHRESEELLHRGVAAFDRGDNDEARDLITRAVETGGPHDVALVFLERLNRLGAPAPPVDAPRPMPLERRARVRNADTPESYGWPLRAFAACALLAAVCAGLLLGGVPLLEWLSGFPAGEPAQERVVTVQPEPVPVARSSELVLTRARSLQAGGHLHDALRLLEDVDAADPFHAEANRLRADLQRQLLEHTPNPTPDGSSRP
jgi:tetratricopeptide (TPR) repeat protein